MARKKPFNDRPFAYRREIELEIETLTNLGVGLGRHPIKDPATGIESKWVVMVPFALPGEKIRARAFRNHKNFSEADLIEVLTPSPQRLVPPCPLFGRCGGCQYQNFTYAEQLSWKQRQVAELVQHMAGLDFAVSPVVGSPKTYAYRSKITPHFPTPHGGFLPIGFLKQGTRFDVLDVPHCYIATDPINAKLTEVRAQVRERAERGAYERGATLLFRDAGGTVTNDYDQKVTEELDLGGGEVLRLTFLARDFFQNNPFILPAFAQYVRDQAKASGAKYLVDAYCGSGLFALASARAFAQVAGVEVSETSVAFATANAQANGLTNASFMAGDASRIFAGLTFPAAETAVVIDPPRKGSDELFLQQLFAFGPKSVVYVSCDPATQMRDLKRFLESGYQVTRIQPFDLFPQTRHLECVITLARA